MRMEKGTANSSGEGGCLFVASLRWGLDDSNYTTLRVRSSFGLIRVVMNVGFTSRDPLGGGLGLD